VAVAFLLSALLLVGLPTAPADTDLLQRAEAAFAAGMQRRDTPDQARPHFLQAARAYAELGRRGFRSPGLSRNEGNAWLLAGDLPRAVLAYRQGLRLSPGDRSLRDALAYAREQAAYPADSPLGRPPASPLPPWLPRVAPAWYLLLALLPYAAGCAALTRWWMVRRGRLLGLAATAFAVAALPTAGFALEEWLARQQGRHPIVVIADDGVLLREGNGLAYPKRYETPLNRGVEAWLLAARGDWLQIELAGGEVGWVPRAYAVHDELTGDWAALEEKPMKRVVFICIENSNRSQMAEAFARMYAAGRVEAYSAGSRPSGRVNPKAVEAMKELGCDLTTHRSKSINDLPEGDFDVAVTMGCGDSCPTLRAKRREDWAIPDPKEMSPEEFRKVRDLIGKKVKELLDEL